MTACWWQLMTACPWQLITADNCLPMTTDDCLLMTVHYCLHMTSDDSLLMTVDDCLQMTADDCLPMTADWNKNSSPVSWAAPKTSSQGLFLSLSLFWQSQDLIHGNISCNVELIKEDRSNSRLENILTIVIKLDQLHPHIVEVHTREN